MYKDENLFCNSTPSATGDATPHASPTPIQTLIPNPSLLGDLGDALLQQEAIARNAKAAGHAPGVETGIENLTEELGGFLAPGIHTLLAAPGAGKTALALQIAATCGCPCLYVTCEMPREELLRRIIARTTSTYLGKLRGGNLSHDELVARLKLTAQECPMLALYDATEQAVLAADIQTRAEALRSRFDSQHLLIVIDSITDWAMGMVGSSDNVSEYLVTERALNAIKGISRNLSCPVIAIAHRNRVGQRAQGTDKLFSGKASGRYEYISESVLDLERDTSEEPNFCGYIPVELTILKNRHGSSGTTLSLQFEGRLQKFKES